MESRRRRNNLSRPGSLDEQGEIKEARALVSAVQIDQPDSIVVPQDPNNVPISSSRMAKPEERTHPWTRLEKNQDCCSKLAALAGGIGWVFRLMMGMGGGVEVQKGGRCK